LPDASWDANIEMVDAEYARIVATLPLILIAPDPDEKVYAPLLLLIPAMTAVNENDASVP
jgi:hypothetical protein